MQNTNLSNNLFGPFSGMGELQNQLAMASHVSDIKIPEFVWVCVNLIFKNKFKRNIYKLERNAAGLGKNRAKI